MIGMVVCLLLAGCQTKPAAPSASAEVDPSPATRAESVPVVAAEEPEEELIIPEQRLIIRYANDQVHIDAGYDKNDELHGLMRVYRPNGRLFEESLWRHGRLIHAVNYGTHGVARIAVEDGNGWRPVLVNGQVGRQEFYNDGEMVGGTFD
jgi:hypothetical protein